MRALLSQVAPETAVRVTPLLTQTDGSRGGFCLLDRTKGSFKERGQCLRKASEEGDGDRGRGRPDQELALDFRDLSGRGVRS